MIVFRSMIAAALVIAMAMIVPVQGASILVATDSGNLGAFTFTNTGIISGTATVLASVPTITSTINTINGVIVPAEPVRVNTPLSFTVAPTGSGTYALHILTPATKTVGATVGSQAIMGFDLTQGDTPAALPNFFNASGPVTSLLANANPLYDFTLFGNGSGKINLTFTATSFTGLGVSSFAQFFSTVGATAVGDGSFSQAAVVVPEPMSALTLGLGLIGSMFIRRRWII